MQVPILFGTGVMTHKILRRLYPENLPNKFTQRSHISSKITRNQRDLQIPRVRLEYWLKTVSTFQ